MRRSIATVCLRRLDGRVNPAMTARGRLSSLKRDLRGQSPDQSGDGHAGALNIQVTVFGIGLCLVTVFRVRIVQNTVGDEARILPDGLFDPGRHLGIGL